MPRWNDVPIALKFTRQLADALSAEAQRFRLASA